MKTIGKKRKRKKSNMFSKKIIIPNSKIGREIRILINFLYYLFLLCLNGVTIYYLDGKRLNVMMVIHDHVLY